MVLKCCEGNKQWDMKEDSWRWGRGKDGLPISRKASWRKPQDLELRKEYSRYKKLQLQKS